MAADHWMLFSTFAEQDFFEFPQPGTYTGVIINANMAAHAPGGLAAFLLEKTAPTTRYLIDPLTHAAQHDPGLVSNADGRPKSSIRKLADDYGGVFRQNLGARPLFPEDFDEDAPLAEFAEACLIFQRKKLSDEILATDAAKYLDGDEEEIHPYALVAPYFFMTESSIEDWLSVNIRAAKLALENRLEQEKVFAEIVISQGVLVDQRLRSSIIEGFTDVAVDGFLIWIDNLDEQFASRAELESLINLSAGLRGEQGREVINLHGGYFSVLASGALGGESLSGVAHAPEFGEYRSVVPVGGGIPISRYYVPDLHIRVRYKDALAAFNTLGYLDNAAVFHNNVCDCQICSDTINGSAENFVSFGQGTTRTIRRGKSIVRIDFPTTESKQLCLKHYLHRKRREYIGSANAPAETLIENLRLGAERYKPAVGLDGVAHLKLWRQFFERL